MRKRIIIFSVLLKDGEFHLSYCDVTTGELKTASFEDETTLINEITTIHPNEIIVNKVYKILYINKSTNY